MHGLNEVLYTWLLLDGKTETGCVRVLSPCNIQLFSDTLIDGRAHCPGSAAKSVLIVGSPSRGYNEFIQLQDRSCREKKQRFYNQVKPRGPKGGGDKRCTSFRNRERRLCKDMRGNTGGK